MARRVYKSVGSIKSGFFVLSITLSLSLSLFLTLLLSCSLTLSLSLSLDFVCSLNSFFSFFFVNGWRLKTNAFKYNASSREENQSRRGAHYFFPLFNVDTLQKCTTKLVDFLFVLKHTSFFVVFTFMCFWYWKLLFYHTLGTFFFLLIFTFYSWLYFALFLSSHYYTDDYGLPSLFPRSAARNKNDDPIPWFLYFVYFLC